MIEEELRRKVDRHDCDLYYGNGKPGITTRMAMAEKEIETVKETVDEIKKDSKQIKMMVLGIILTVLGEIAAKLLVH